MDKALKEALDAIQTLRAALWVAYHGAHPDEVLALLNDTGAVLHRNGEPDELNGESAQLSCEQG